jgi:hypothetical protein
MTTAADDTADEAAFEAFLAGRPVPGQVDGGSPAVAAFAGAVRATATLPGRPSAALAELLVTGLLTDQPSPSTRTAPSAGSTPRRSRVRRRRFAMFFPALLAKFLSAGAVAQACSGAGIALVAFTGAGAAGVLPGPVQDTFSSVVGSDTTAADESTTPEEGDGAATATPTETGTGTGEASGVTAVPELPVELPVETPVVTPEVPAPADLSLDAWKAGPTPGQSFGDWVSQGARHGYADGKVISSFAHKRNDDRRSAAAATSAPAAGSEAPEADDDRSSNSSPEVEHESRDESGHESGHGRGNGGGNGGGNNGHGHN